MRLIKPSDKEVWVPIFDNHYAVSSFGRVRRIKSGGNRGRDFTHDYIKFVLRKGYYYFTPSVNGRVDGKCVVHQLVAKVFLGDRPDGKQVNHKDGNKLNNAACNLEYMTSKENTLHAHKIGLAAKQDGENNGNAKLNWETVVAMRNDRTNGMTYKEINNRYECSGAYYAINHGWKQEAL